jgi:hypothetical protein
VAIAAAAAASALVIRSRSALPAVHGAHAVYVCPMHPDVTSGSPGDCPICHMALVAQAGAGPASPAADSHEDPDVLTLPAGLEIRGFDAFSKAKQFDFAFEMRAPAAVETATTGVAAFHLDEADLIRPGEEGVFSPSSGATPGKPFWIKVRVASEPPLRRDRSTVVVRFDLDPGAALPAGQTGTLKLDTRQRKGLVVRKAAVLQSPEGPYVLVASEDHRTLTRRPVEIGRTIAGYTAIVSGLREGEYVLAQHAFVLDLERRLARRVSP